MSSLMLVIQTVLVELLYDFSYNLFTQTLKGIFPGFKSLDHSNESLLELKHLPHLYTIASKFSLFWQSVVHTQSFQEGKMQL